MDANRSSIRKEGKTTRDHASGAWARHLENAEVRKAWNKEGATKGAKRSPFPLEVCNGRESQALKRIHKCNRKAVPGQKGGGACRHRKGRRA